MYEAQEEMPLLRVLCLALLAEACVVINRGRACLSKILRNWTNGAAPTISAFGGWDGFRPLLEFAATDKDTDILPVKL